MSQSRSTITVLFLGCCALSALAIGFHIDGSFGGASNAYGQVKTKSETSVVTVVVSRDDCRRLVKHVPAADVAFRPGVDARGGAVAPADLAGSPTLEFPDAIRFDITVDLMSRLGLPDGSPLAPKGEAVIGTVGFDILSGRVTFNDEPIGDPEAAAIAAACRDLGG